MSRYILRNDANFSHSYIGVLLVLPRQDLPALRLSMLSRAGGELLLRPGSQLLVEWFVSVAVRGYARSAGVCQRKLYG
jgi:hypothetical protein